METDLLARALAIAALATSALTLIWLVIDAWLIDAPRLKLQFDPMALVDSDESVEHVLLAVLTNHGKRGTEVRGVWLSSQSIPARWKRRRWLRRLFKWKFDVQSVVEFDRVFVEGQEIGRWPQWLAPGRSVWAIGPREAVLKHLAGAKPGHIATYTTKGWRRFPLERLPSEVAPTGAYQVWPIRPSDPS